MLWSEKVKERDGWKCVSCGRTDRLQAHHIKPTHLYPEFKNDVDNGVTLCQGCHQRYHGDNFAGDKLLPINGIDPDPEGRQKEYRAKLNKLREERKRTAKSRGLYLSWSSNLTTGPMILEAAEMAGQSPSEWLAEAIFMRLLSEGIECDKDTFMPPWRYGH